MPCATQGKTNEPLSLLERASCTPGLKAPEVAHDGTSGRTAGRPAQGFGCQLPRAGIRSGHGCPVAGVQLLATGRGWRCEPPPPQRKPDGWPMRRIGACPPPRRSVTTRLLPGRWGQARTHGLPRAQLRKPPRLTSFFAKTISGRRQFAPAKPGRWDSRLAGRRDENAHDDRPLAVEAARGENTPGPMSPGSRSAATSSCTGRQPIAWCAGSCPWVAAATHWWLHVIRTPGRIHPSSRGG